MTPQLQSKKKQKKSAPTFVIPERFKTARSTLFADKFMTHFIKIGGVGVILAVLGIFVFITAQIIPLFSGAEVKAGKSFSFPKQSYVAMGVDEWGELPFVVNQSGELLFMDAVSGELRQKESVDLGDAEDITVLHYSMKDQGLFVGTQDGQFILANIHYRADFEGDARTINADLISQAPLEIGNEEPIVDLDYSDAGDEKLVAAIQKKEDEYFIRAVTLTQEQTLFGAGEVELDEEYDLTEYIQDEPQQILVNSQADAIVVATKGGKIHFFYLDDGELELRQTFEPFGELEGIHKEVASIGPIFGDVSLSFTNSDGLNRIYSLYIPKGENKRHYGLTKEFEALPGAASFFHESVRNKAFLTGVGNFASLRYVTTEAIRWQQELPFNVVDAKIGGKYKKLYFLDDQSQFHIYQLKDEHPEAGYNAFFKKLWYEGYSEPTYQWQSTGGTDDFEPKLSLIPLIIGTLKGTFYAMLFALPIALLSALYTSQFANPRFKIFIKPMLEIMASLPSVVLGFLAALWLAPLIEDRVPSLIAMLTLIPLSALMVGWLWNQLSIDMRLLFKPGYEWVYFIPIVLLMGYIGWQIGPLLERLFFVVQDPDTSEKIASFKRWWPSVTGASFEQRNSLVVGFIMGFAVIPIIFTIAEDALSNVPQTLKAGSLALGASRWQTAFRVILPTAFPGIFSAAMIGFGRAVGETMIVVMATGNTPIMEWNIFNGFRTLSANIAVELPEAPYLGTLYRTLFLGALVLFVMTFVVNSIAEVIRQHLREKYKTV